MTSHYLHSLWYNPLYIVLYDRRLSGSTVNVISDNLRRNSTPIVYHCFSHLPWLTLNKANLRDLIAAIVLAHLLKLDSNRRFLSLYDLKMWWMTSRNIFYTTSSLCIITNPSVNSNWSHSPETLNSGSKSVIFFVQCDLEIWWMTLENNRAPFLYYVKLWT